MTTHHDEQIPVTRLNLDTKNPRHPEQDSQREILQWMTQGTGRIGEKLLILAADIAANGLNPAERVMVSIDKTKSDEYIVIEGNRRVAAIKLINNPDLVSSERSQL